jgi:polyphosphate kinase 2
VNVRQTTTMSKKADASASDRPPTIGDLEHRPPYPETVPKKEYERELHALQVELVKMQQWVIDKGERIVVVFEGRDAAGKGGAISRITQYLNPRQCRVAALPKPNDTERTQWYFQRYVSHLPTAGEIVLFDRSWYNRAGVERVMGFCTDAEYEEFFHQAPSFERSLVRSGISLHKLWFTVSKDEQRQRFEDRKTDPLRQWKLSPIDDEALHRFDEYGEARDAMLLRTDHADAPWTVINSNDKRRARLETIRHLLSTVPYRHHSKKAVGAPDRRVVVPAETAMEPRPVT